MYCMPLLGFAASTLDASTAGANVAPAESTPQQLAAEALRIALSIEDRLLARRVTRIRDKAVQVLSELRTVADRLQRRLLDFAGERYRLEIRNTERLIELVRALPAC